LTDHKYFHAKLNALPDMLKWVRVRLKDADFSSSERKKIELAIEEALVNIIYYAYNERSGSIDLDVNCQGSWMQFMIVDKGIPFNPLDNIVDIHLDSPIQERKPGGLGIYLINELMDHIEYERLGNTNVLKLIKRLPSAQ